MGAITIRHLDGCGGLRPDRSMRRRDGRRSFTGCFVVGVSLELWDMRLSRILGEFGSLGRLYAGGGDADDGGVAFRPGR